MSKLNKNGLTLVELLVSIVLLGSIMAFMYKLISDVKSEKREIDTSNDNYIKIQESVLTIENELATKNPHIIELIDNEAIFKDKDKNKLFSLSIDNNVIELGSRKWAFQDIAKLKYCYLAKAIINNLASADSIPYNILIKIMLYDKNDKYIDAIEVPYYEKNLNVIVNANNSNWNECS